MRYKELIAVAALLLLFGTLYWVVNNDNDGILNVKLQLKYGDLIRNLDGIQQEDLEWLMKHYIVNNEKTFDTKLFWILKRYRVDNDNNDNKTANDNTKLE